MYRVSQKNCSTLDSMLKIMITGTDSWVGNPVPKIMK